MAAAPSAATPVVNRWCGQAPAPGKVAHYIFQAMVHLLQKGRPLQDIVVGKTIATHALGPDVSQDGHV